MADGPRILRDDRDHCIGIWRNLGVAIWRSRVTEGIALSARELTRELVTQFPQGFGLLNVIQEGIGIPTPEARAIFATALRTASPRLLRAGVVVEGAGFQAAAIRAFSAGINLFIRATFPFHIFTALPDAAPWLAEGLGGFEGKKTQPQEIVIAVREMRERPLGASARG